MTPTVQSQIIFNITLLQALNAFSLSLCQTACTQNGRKYRRWDSKLERETGLTFDGFNSWETDQSANRHQCVISTSGISLQDPRYSPNQRRRYCCY